MSRCTKVRKSIRSTRSRSASCLRFHRGETGVSKANQALSDHASEAITMYAQFASSVLSGACRERTWFLSFAIRFSWLHRSFDSRTTAAQLSARSFVM